MAKSSEKFLIKPGSIIPFTKLQITQNHSRTWMSFVLLATDSFGLVLAGLAGVGLRMLLSELINPPFYWNLLGLIPIFLAVFAMRGLYPAVGLSPVEELRRLSLSSSVVFLFFAAFTFWVRTAEYFSRLVIAFSWLFALITIPLCRWVFRVVTTNLGMWGEPVAVVGQGEHTRKIVVFLLERMRFGIRPVIILNGEQDELESPVPIMGMEDFLAKSKELSGLQTAVLVDGEIPVNLQHALLNEQKFGFRRLILISDHTWIGSL
jgi:FlaA1/EpsC-like NDP-sugar epimerase